MNQQPSSLQKILSALIIFTVLALLGALPAGLLGLMGGTRLALDMYLLAAIIIGSWMPLKALVDRFVKGQGSLNYLIPFRITLTSLTLLLFGSMVLIPVLYAFTFTAFLAGLMSYLITGNHLIIALIAALAVQTYSHYRSAQREKELGETNNLFVRFHDMNMSMNYDLSIDAQSSRAAQEPYDDEPDLILLPAESSERLQQVDDATEDMIIIIDSEETESEQDES